MIFGDKSRMLREALATRDILRVVGGHNGLSAKLVEAHGFDAVWASGFELSTSYAVPDASVLTMSEYLLAAQTMNDAVGIPIIADCDTGFGNELHVAHMVRRYESHGIAAVCIEDKKFPKLNSFIGDGQELESLEVFADKIATGKASQRGADFMLIARTEALISGLGVDEALRRAHAYVDAGADAILVHSKARTPVELFAFMQAWDGRAPIVAVPTSYAGVTADELARAGVRVVIYANQAMRASVQAMNGALAEIRESGSTGGLEQRIAPMRELFAIQGMETWGRVPESNGKVAVPEPGGEAGRIGEPPVRSGT